MMTREVSGEERSQIQADFRGSKNPKEQLAVVAQLHDLTEADVLEIIGMTREELTAPTRPVDGGRDPRGKRFTPEDKRRAVERVLSGESRTQVAKQYGTSEVSLRNWVKAYQQEGVTIVRQPGGSGPRTEANAPGVEPAEEPEKANSDGKEDALERLDRYETGLKQLCLAAQGLTGTGYDGTIAELSTKVFIWMGGYRAALREFGVLDDGQV